jgi:hypothetical protein
MDIPKTKFEQQLLTLLTNPAPEPQYKLGQTCMASGYEAAMFIVGSYWVTIDYAWHNQLDPGWYYVLQSQDNTTHHYIEEGEITLVEAQSNAATE